MKAEKYPDAWNNNYLKDKGYWLSYSGDRYYVYTDYYDDGDDAVDIIGIDTYNNIISVYASYNGWEEREDEDRLKLRDIQMELWDIQPDVKRADLEAIRRIGIVNKPTVRQIEKVYAAVGKAKDQTLIFDSDDTNDEEEWALLANTPFYGGTKKLLDEYKVGKSIARIIIRPTTQVFGDHDMEFRFSQAHPSLAWSMKK
ncbi:hypothetical protein CORC01_02710 [Colletotrichum orchidophilum]|uniref:Uncharacterized protein n=1 Tax=Colletotrichum orchidophilum TaxID=1209926 RepID=A0A1G4BL13_9PEZI|nr:uncharacterized protein CORC01_02710 [Colletotrichum orchidophilum]OHF02131.1 hypothetical protein CORC01_02710 [Colletotrichum orchidophilum]